jgi:protoporphyrinogen/coproporphyrinogen III oxidase
MRPVCVIVGGGISGLAAAYELHSRRVPFVLLEGSARFGGLVRTEIVDRFVIDAGPDAILTLKPAGIALCRELGVDLLPVRTPGTFIARGSRLERLPESGAFGIPFDWRGFAGTRAFSTAGKFRMAAEYFLPASPPDTPHRDESIAKFVGRRFGREAVQVIAEPLMAGIHGGDAECLSMRALFPRFVDLERREGSVIRGLRRVQQQGGGQLPAPFASVRGGTEALITALIDLLPRENLMVKTPVRGIERADMWRVHLADGNHVDAHAVLLATPPRVTANLSRDHDPQLSELCGRIRDRSPITVALGYRRDQVRHPLQGSGFVVPKSEGATVSAVTFVTSKWWERAPGDRVLLRAFLGGARDPEAMRLSDADVIARVCDDLRRYLQISSDPMIARVYRMPHAAVQLEVGHLDLLKGIETRLNRSAGLFISAAGFRGVGIADCVGDARLQAAAVASSCDPFTQPMKGRTKNKDETLAAGVVPCDRQEHRRLHSE